ncbi:MAG: organoarsenical effux MFS transporter ArsJ, partial [Verrucomicrobiota bacterium]
MSDLRNYSLVTGAYWAFTLTDGALRMLVLLYFHKLGYTPLEVALLFLFYEIFGVITNLVGGWIGARLGLKITLYAGLFLQIGALCGLALLPEAWPRAGLVAYVMAMQALSGISKDLTKMSSKSAVKLVVTDGGESRLFRWVAILTGSKNALKGVGFFLGAALLQRFGFSGSLWGMAIGLVMALSVCGCFLRGDLGKSKAKPKFQEIFSKTPSINWLSAARMFLFGARDVWFVVGLPVFLSGTLGWTFDGVGGFLAIWVIGYGIVQAGAPGVLQRIGTPTGRSATILAGMLGTVMLLMSLSLQGDRGGADGMIIIVGLGLFGIVFALNSAVHSYLIVSYSDPDKVALNVGFYYMANAMGRLMGTVLSGALFQWKGLPG